MRPRGPRGGRDFRARRKVCVFCVDKVKNIDYKDAGRLRRFLSDRGKIEPRRKTGTCAKHQRRLSVALKRARFMSLLPYTGEHIHAVDRPMAPSAPMAPAAPQPAAAAAPAPAGA
jgi:small subunit ribosomal protein S18